MHCECQFLILVHSIQAHITTYCTTFDEETSILAAITSCQILFGILGLSVGRKENNLLVCMMQLAEKTSKFPSVEVCSYTFQVATHH